VCYTLFSATIVSFISSPASLGIRSSPSTKSPTQRLLW
jgi:hypothetical protein